MNEKKILVVDDEAFIRDMLESAFGKVGYSVCSVASAEDALSILEHENFPVMFIDLALKTISGFELCERIRSNKPNALIYAISGYAKLLGKDEILEAGFNDCFAKPLNIKTLFQVVEEAFEKIDEIAKNDTPNQHIIKQILIIDDNKPFRKMLGKILLRMGFEICEASSGDEGIKHHAEKPVDLIIIDIIMPGKNGIETMLEIKEMDPEVKFIVVSGGGGYVYEINFDIAEKLGAITLQKPFKREEILTAIGQLQN